MVAFGVDNPPGDPDEHAGVVALHQQLFRQIPKLGKTPIEAANAAIHVHDENAVGCRLQRRAQLGDDALQLLFGVALLTAINHRHQEAGRALVKLQQAGAAFDLPDFAIGATQQGLGADCPRSTSGDIFPKEQILRSRSEINDRPSNLRVAREAQEIFGSTIDGDNAQIDCVHQPDRFENAFDQHLRHSRNHVGSDLDVVAERSKK